MQSCCSGPGNADKCFSLVQGRRHEESDSDDEWTDNEEDSAPLDDVDPFVFFADSLRSVQSQMPARFQVGPCPFF